MEDEQSKTMGDKPVKKNIKALTLTEILEEILSRLPVKSLLRFRSTSQEWRSLISHPRFTKLHFTRATASDRAALLLFAYNVSARRRYFLSAALDGGPVTHIMTLQNSINDGDNKVLEHLNGLAFLASKSFRDSNYAIVLNPSTRKFFQLPDTAFLSMYGRGWDSHYFFGFDESRSDYKILNVKVPGFVGFGDFTPAVCEFMIFSLSSQSWRKIDVVFPVEVTRDRWHYTCSKRGVCVNSAIHLILGKPLEILAFDLTTEKFSFVKIHPDAEPQNAGPPSRPRLIEINGLLGVVCHHRVVESNEMDIWILQDYENCVWVKESITFPEPWNELDCPFPLASGNSDNIIFSPRKLAENLISVLIYNTKSRCFKSIQLTLGHQFLCSEDVKFEPITRYVESLVSLS